jgi:hypothetical protein
VKSKWQIYAIVAGLAVVLGVAAGFLIVTRQPSSSVVRKVETQVPEKLAKKTSSQLKVCPLDGRETDSDVVRPLAIMVENLTTIRPQAGTADACVVVEGLAEGGITRFMLVFGAHGSENVGPVRSARIHYTSLAKGWDAIYGHVGGSIYALDAIRKWGVFDWDQSVHGGDYTRITSTKAPHNVFTSTKRLRDAAASKETRTAPMKPIFKFKAAPSLNERPEGFKSVVIDFSDPGYRVEYQYDRQTNTYKRFNGGQPQVDFNTKKQLTPTNIVVIRAPHTPIPGGSGVLDVDMTAGGEAKVFRDGTVVEGSWSRADVDSPLKLADSDGNNIELTPGQTWIEIVQPTTPIKIQQ